jgi:hypothetical protein
MNHASAASNGDFILAAALDELSVSIAGAWFSSLERMFGTRKP